MINRTPMRHQQVTTRHQRTPLVSIPGRQRVVITPVYGPQSVTSLSLPVSRRRSRSCLPTWTSHLLAAGKKHKPTSNTFFLNNPSVITFGYDIPRGGFFPPLENPPKEKKLVHELIFSTVEPRKNSSRPPQKPPSSNKIKGIAHE